MNGSDIMVSMLYIKYISLHPAHTLFYWEKIIQKY